MSKENFEDYLTDAKFGIHTAGRNDKHSDTHKYPYEPTEYFVLDRLIDSGFIDKTDVLMDYGCGMGRVPIYLNKRVGCIGYGIECVKEFYEKARENVVFAGCEEKIIISLGTAERFLLPENVTACFFFNPFDLGILRNVMKQVRKSYEENPRRIMFFFYYPQDEYVAFLMTAPGLEFVDEIDCAKAGSESTRRDIIMVFSMNA